MLRKRLTCVAALLLALALVGSVTAGPQQASTPTGNERLRVASGEKLVIELETAINTTTARVGDRVLFRTARDIMANGKTAIPKGSLIGGTITRVQSAQNSKRAEIEFRLDAFKFDDGTEVPVTAEPLKVKGDDSGRGTKTVLNGVITQGLGQAAQGAVLGGLFGGRKAAGIGAALGLGATLLGQTVLQPRIPGPELDLSQGSVIESRLKKPLDVPVRVASLPVPTRTAANNASSRPNDFPSASSRPNDFPSNDRTIGRDPIRDNPDLSDLRPTVEKAGANRPDDPSAPVVYSNPGDASLPVPVFTDAAPAAAPPVSTAAALPPDSPLDGPPPVVLSVNVNLAQVDALVRDRAGRPLNNLTIGDFRLFEDGVERQVQTFSKDELPLAVALVIDRSGSVAPLMAQIQSAAYQAISQLKTGDAVCLFSFAGDVQLLEPLTTDRQRVANRIGSIGAGGGTDIVDAVYEAMSYLEEAAYERRRAVILISDNQDVSGRMTVSQAVQLAHRSETVVYSVKIDAGGFGLPSVFPRFPGPFSVGGNPVPEIARESGGEIFDVSSSGSIDRALATAVGRLKTRYTLGYSPASEDAKDAYHRIEIKLVERFGRPDSDYTVLAQTRAYGVTGRRRR